MSLSQSFLNFVLEVGAVDKPTNIPRLYFSPEIRLLNYSIHAFHSWVTLICRALYDNTVGPWVQRNKRAPTPSSEEQEHLIERDVLSLCCCLLCVFDFCQ